MKPGPGQRDNILASKYEPGDGRTLEWWRRRRLMQVVLTWMALAAAAVIVSAAAWVYWSPQAGIGFAAGFIGWLYLLVCEAAHADAEHNNQEGTYNGTSYHDE